MLPKQARNWANAKATATCAAPEPILEVRSQPARPTAHLQVRLRCCSSCLWRRLVVPSRVSPAKSGATSLGRIGLAVHGRKSAVSEGGVGRGAGRPKAMERVASNRAPRLLTPHPLRRAFEPLLLAATPGRAQAPWDPKNQYRRVAPRNRLCAKSGVVHVGNMCLEHPVPKASRCPSRRRLAKFRGFRWPQAAPPHGWPPASRPTGQNAMALRSGASRSWCCFSSHMGVSPCGRG